MKTLLRGLAVAGLILLTITLQVSVFSHFALAGVAPDLALLLVIGAALVRGPTYGALVGFAAGLVLDLGPPADATAGRWALALVLVGWLTGLTRSDGHQSVLSVVLVVAAGAFVGTSLYALSGLALGEQSVTVGSALQAVPIATGYDVLLTPLVLPPLLLAFRRLQPARSWR